jgi:hypothetical protein
LTGYIYTFHAIQRTSSLSIKYLMFIFVLILYIDHFVFQHRRLCDREIIAKFRKIKKGLQVRLFKIKYLKYV